MAVGTGGRSTVGSAVRALAHVPARLVLVLAVTVASAGTLTVVHDRFWAPPTLPVAADVANPRVSAATDTLVATPTPTLPTVSQLAPPEDDGESGDPSPVDEAEAADDVDAAIEEERASVVVEAHGGRRGDVPGRSADSTLPLLDRDELAATAHRVGIPERAVAAYASAALQLREERPGCGLTWVTLAGIGWVESQHGAYGGTQLRDDGSLTQPIIGVPLDGGPGVRAIPDTDGGRYDGDATWDRAVGPMQFIPSTWARYGVDANGSGEADPQHVDDAALAAARYLCAGGGDLTEGGAWVRAVRSYNHSDEYVGAVLTAADRYAERANG